MIKFEGVYTQYVSEFYTLYDLNCEITNNTLFVGDFFDGTISIMRTLAKIDKDYKGRILVDDVDLKNIKDKDLNLIYLPENPVLFKNKNLFENLFFPLKIRKIKKKSAKNLIYSIFSKLKNNNFNFLENYLTGENEKLKYIENIKNDNLNNLKIENIFKLKIGKLNPSEQKIITLIRSILRQPKYILIENFFCNLEERYKPLAVYLLNQIKKSSTIIACEKSLDLKTSFNGFEIVDFTNKT